MNQVTVSQNNNELDIVELSLVPKEEDTYLTETVNHLKKAKPVFSWSDLYGAH